MDECCAKWINNDVKLIPLNISLHRTCLDYCPECGSNLTPDKVELEEMSVSNEDVTIYRVFAKEINKIIRYLKQ